MLGTDAGHKVSNREKIPALGMDAEPDVVVG
jgi:hypothetical protein